MSRVYDGMLTALRGRPDDDDDLVRQLVQAADVDRVIERMEMDHYERLSPILQSVTSFNCFPPREDSSRPVRKQQRQQQVTSFERRLFTPLRSPVREEEGQSSRHEPRKSRETLRQHQSMAITSPVPLETQEREQGQRPQARATGGVPPPSCTPSQVCEKGASSAAHEEDHTEKPCIPQQHGGRSTKMTKLWPPGDCSDTNNLQPPLPLHRKQSWDSAFSRKCHSNAPHVLSATEHTRRNRTCQPGSRDLCREPSSVRAPSSEAHPRRDSTVTWDSRTCHHRHAHRRLLTPPPLDDPLSWHRSSSPPVVAPLWSFPLGASAWTQDTERDFHSTQQDYWGCMNDGFENTSTDSTEEARTQNKATFEGDRAGNDNVVVSPRVIKREQHRRPPAMETLPDTSRALEKAPRGQMFTQEGESTTLKSGSLHAPSINVHAGMSGSSSQLAAKGAGSNGDTCHLVEQSYLGKNYSSSLFVPAGDDNSPSSVTKHRNGAKLSPEPEICSSIASETRHSTTFLLGNDNTLRPDISLKKKSDRRKKHALLQSCRQTSTSAFKSPCNGGSPHHGKDVHSRRQKDVETMEPAKGGVIYKMKKEYAAVNESKNDKETRSSSSSYSREGSASYSYSYDSYSDLSSIPVKAWKPLSSDAVGKCAAPLRSGDLVTKPQTKPKIMFSENLGGQPSVQRQRANTTGPPTFKRHSALEREKMRCPPPPGGAMAPQSQLRSSSRMGHADRLLDCPFYSASTSFVNSVRGSPIPVEQSGAPLSASVSRPEGVTKYDKRLGEFAKPYVSYLSHGTHAPTEDMASTTLGRGRSQIQRASVHTARSCGLDNGKEIVWRTEGKDFVRNTRDNVASAVQTMLGVKSVSPQQRSASAGVHPPPPKDLPSRVGKVMKLGRSASAKRSVDLPRQPSNTGPSLLQGSERTKPETAASGGTARLPKSGDQVTQTQRIFINILEKPKSVATTTHRSASVGGHFVQVL